MSKATFGIKQLEEMTEKDCYPRTTYFMKSHFRTIIYLDREKRIFMEANLISVGGKKLNSVLRLSFDFHKGKIHGRLFSFLINIVA